MANDTPADPDGHGHSAEATLDAAKSSGGMAYVAAADRLIASGAELPYAHRQAVEQIRGAISRVHDSGGHLSARDAYAWADRAAAKGMPAEQVKATMAAQGHEWQPGTLPENRVHASDYFFAQPVGLPEAGFRELDSDARALCSTLGLKPEQAGNLVRSVFSASAELDRAADRAAVVSQWESRLAQIFPDAAKLKEATELVAGYLKSAGDNRLAARIIEHKAHLEPFVFMTLRNRAIAAKA